MYYERNTSDVLAGCIPIGNILQNGSIQRNDFEDGGMVYQFHCDEGFHVNGPAAIHCYKGQGNGSKPSCEPIKGERSAPSILASLTVDDNNNTNTHNTNSEKLFSNTSDSELCPPLMNNILKSVTICNKNQTQCAYCELQATVWRFKLFGHALIN